MVIIQCFRICVKTCKYDPETSQYEMVTGLWLDLESSDGSVVSEQKRLVRRRSPQSHNSRFPQCAGPPE
ncbi:MAG: hypothetical protein RQ760_13120 [Sedimentisphaerales bacterium]|nr:hypothetical protein [Sedimentisphaerales bacterium]